MPILSRRFASPRHHSFPPLPCNPREPSRHDYLAKPTLPAAPFSLYYGARRRSTPRARTTPVRSARNATAHAAVLSFPRRTPGRKRIFSSLSGHQTCPFFFFSLHPFERILMLSLNGSIYLSMYVQRKAVREFMTKERRGLLRKKEIRQVRNTIRKFSSHNFTFVHISSFFLMLCLYLFFFSSNTKPEAPLRPREIYHLGNSRCYIANVKPECYAFKLVEFS